MFDAIVEIAIYAVGIGVLAGAYFVFEWTKFIGSTMIDEWRETHENKV